AVFRGSTSMLEDGRVHVELAFFAVPRPPVAKDTPIAAAVRRTYDVPSMEIPSVVHRFGNDVVAHVTSIPSSFGPHLVFSRTIGEGQKGIYRIASDGDDYVRLPALSNHAIAPVYGPGREIYYSAHPPGDAPSALYRLGYPGAFVTMMPGRVI